MFSQSNFKGDFKFILVHNKNATQQNLVSATAAQTLNLVNHHQFPFASEHREVHLCRITGAASQSAVSRAVLGS